MFKEIPLNTSDNRGNARYSVLGKGINDAPYKCTYKVNGVRYICPYYTRWVDMLTRCYSPRWLKAHPSYIGCYVVDSWLIFSNFKKWMIQQDWENKHLDKDLLSLGSLVYSPETCIFITPEVNSFFNLGRFKDKKSSLPPGIYFRNNKYEVGVSTGESKRKWVGSYKTIDEAIDNYLTAKKAILGNLIKKQADPKISAAITNYFEYFSDMVKALKPVY